MTVTSGDNAIVVWDTAVVRGTHLIQGILSIRNFLNLRRIRGPEPTARTWLTVRGPRPTGRDGLAARAELTVRAGRMTGSPGRRVTGARWPWRSPGRARPRHPIHASERNRCNA